MRQKRPQTLICRQTTHDVAHENYENYLTEVRSTDDAIGKVFDWVKSDAYFSQNTAIVIRPEFGRDDEVNADGHLHHSYGFYYAHRVASIFWGPDFNRGVDRETVITSLDMAPTIAALFDAGAMSARSRIAPGLFRFA
jgi:membrane-anchored protein YejM (alkaline phosphatase superfamily)